MSGPIDSLGPVSSRRLDAFRSAAVRPVPALSPAHPVAHEIARQVGPQAFRMLGTTLRVTDVDSLTFDVRSSCRWNRVKVTLAADDTYTVQFFKILAAGPRFGQVKAGEPHEGIYCDMLHDLIESETGLYVSLAPRR